MDKKTKEYLRDKHKSLNGALLTTRDKNLEQLDNMVSVSNDEIRTLERGLKWMRFGFYVLFAITIIAGIIISVLTGAGILIGALSASTGYGFELSAYYAMTKDVQLRLSDLRHDRSKIESELIMSSKEISKTLIEEQRAITSVLTKEKLLLPTHLESDEDIKEEVKGEN